MKKVPRGTLSVPGLIAAAAAHYGLAAVEIKGYVRAKVRRLARDLAFRLLRDIAGLDAPSIGLLMDQHPQTVKVGLRAPSKATLAFESSVWAAARAALEPTETTP